MITATPAQCGVRNSDLQKLLNRFDKRGINTHSILMARGGKLFFERYWAPFTAETPHRMYSVTKSFVSVAIGQLWAEGKLSLDDPICRYFPDKLPENVHPWLQQQNDMNEDVLVQTTPEAPADTQPETPENEAE